MPINGDELAVDEREPEGSPPPSGGGGGSETTESGESTQTQESGGGQATSDAEQVDPRQPRSASALRRRALAAESRVEELAKSLEEARSALERAQRELAQRDRRADIDAALIEAGAVDLETARLLAEAADEESDGKGDPRVLVAELKRRKPFLFRTAAQRRSGGAMAAAAVEDESAALQQAAEAAANGDRGALLRFLRLRREI